MKLLEVTIHAEDSSFAEITATDEVIEAVREVARQINAHRGEYGPVIRLRVDGMEEEEP